MVSGASVCPMKMLAATLRDSAPLAPHHASHHPGCCADDDLHHADVIENREKKAAMKMMVGRTWKANEKAKLGDFFWLADITEYERGNRRRSS